MNVKANGDDPGTGALVGCISGGLIGAITGLVGRLQPAALGYAALVNAGIAGGADLITQKVSYDKKVKNGEDVGEFKVNAASTIAAAGIAEIGTVGGVGLSTAESVGAAIITGSSGGYFASLGSAVLNLMINLLF